MADPTQQPSLWQFEAGLGFLGRLSTGVKMLIILSLALLPLGLIALFASRESAQVNRLRHEAEARGVAMTSGAAITTALAPATLGLRQAVNDLADSITQYPPDHRQCSLRLQAVAERNRAVSGLAIYTGQGGLVCSTRGYRNVPAHFPSLVDGAYEIRLAPEYGMIWTSVSAGKGYFGVAEFPASTIAALLPTINEGREGTALRQGGQIITLRTARTSNPLDQIIKVTVPVEGGQLGLEMQMPASPLSAVDVLLILLPILMWAAGGVIGWVVVDHLLLRPLGQLQRAIAVFSRGEGPLTLPRLNTPAKEIRELGESFQRATETLQAHEQELAEGLDNQKRLTREVHHRVKNNLQVVSSLINLHSRGAASDPVLEAYASIQRRVDALAVVHRNHYAELEQNQGVSLRALIGEIASNLRASTGLNAAQMSITLNIMSASATQDAAVPVAFLITEIVELVMLCGPSTHIAISLTPVPSQPTRGLLTIEAPTLASEPCLKGANAERFKRIAGGLARQLRSPLDHDLAAGRYAIEITISQSPPSEN